MTYDDFGLKLWILFWSFVYQPLLMLRMTIMSLESSITQEEKGRYFTVSGMDGSYLTPRCLSKYSNYFVSFHFNFKRIARKQLSLKLLKN